MIARILIALFVLFVALSAQAADVVVAPHGDDAGPGTSSRPLATLPAAVKRVLAIRARQPERLEPVVVEIRGGRYELEGPVLLGADDSGSARSATIYRAAAGEQPVFSGGRVIGGWRVGDDGMWRTTLPEVRAGQWRFRELFVNGQRRTRARFPNEGWLRVRSAGPDRRTSFTFAPGDVAMDAAGNDTELVFLHDWSVSRIKVAAIDRATHTLTTAAPIGCRAAHFAIDNFEPHPRYALENHPSFLDAPGEWRLDAKSGELAYKPLAGERPADAVVIAPKVTSLLAIRGEAGRPVEHVRMEGLGFEHCAWALPTGGYAEGQANFHENRDGGGAGGELRQSIPAAVTVELARDIVLSGCQFERLGGAGVRLGKQTFGCVIERCRVADIAGNGVMIGEGALRPAEQTATGNVLRDSVIERCGRVFFGAVGAWIGLTRGTVVEYNEIAHHPYTGVSLGWKWDPSPTAAADNRISHNHIHHVMQLLSDGGGIYTLGHQPGSTLSHNTIHDVSPNSGRAESNGMFLDEGTSEMVIEHNAIWGVGRSPLRFHKAGQNRVRHNVLVVGPGVPPIRYNATPQSNIELRDNRVVAASAFNASSVGEQVKRAGPRTIEQ